MDVQALSKYIDGYKYLLKVIDVFEHAAGNHLNDEHTIFLNKIFDTLLKLNTPHSLEATET